MDPAVDDPYGLPRFAGDETLVGWVDHSDIAMRSVRILTHRSTTAIVISHPGVWDLIVSDGHGNVTTDVMAPDDIFDALRRAVSIDR